MNTIGMLGLSALIASSLFAQTKSPLKRNEAIVFVDREGRSEKEINEFARLVGTLNEQEWERKGFRVWEIDGNRYFVLKKLFALDEMESKKRLLDYFTHNLALGTMTLNLADCPEDIKGSIKQVLTAERLQIDDGLAPLIHAPALKVTLEPVIVAKFESNGVQKNSSAFPYQDQAKVLTKEDPIPGNTKSSDELQLVETMKEPTNVIAFRFVGNPVGASIRLTAIKAFSTSILPEIEALQSEFSDSYRKTFTGLMAAYHDQMGQIAPPKRSDFSGMSPELQKLFARTIESRFASAGFESAGAADAWIRSSRLVASTNYINIVFGGTDAISGKPRMASIIFTRP